MAYAIENIIAGEEKKCNPEILEKVIKLIGEGKSYKDIINEVGISEFTLSTYIEVAFYRENFDPSLYVEQDKVTQIMKLLESSSFPALKEIKNKVPDCEYSDIRVVRGVYFRTKHYYQKKTKTKVDTKPQNEQVSLLDTMEVPKTATIKVDINTVPFLAKCIEKLETEHWKTFATELFSKYTPKQFFLLPASMSSKNHHETELDFGEFDISDPQKLIKMGGKYYHSYRVLCCLEEIIEPDSAEIWDYTKKKVAKYTYGNEFQAWERDAMKVAALSHDIYSGGTNDDLNPKMRHMDKKHPYYHETELQSISNLVPEEQWKVFIEMVSNHMWKWSPKDTTIKFHEGKNASSVEECYNFYKLYRMVKNMELADFIASRRNSDIVPRFKQAINTWYFIKKDINITWEDLQILGIEEKELRDAFAKEKEPIEEFIKVVIGSEKYLEIKNASLMK